MASPFKDDVLSSDVALITGGGSGIGFEIARQLGRHGASLVITGRRKPVLDAASEALTNEGLNVLAVQGDVRSEQDRERAVQAAAQHFGKLSVLVNCAAGNFLSPAEKLSSGGFRTVMEIDALGTFAMSSAALPLLRQSGGGCIINISATLQYGATWFQVHSSAAKAAVDSITRSLALEWGSFNVRVNGVAPGPIANTAGMAKLAPGMDVPNINATIPVGRMGKTEDIGLACVFLASSAASFISGDTLIVDGGGWMWKPQMLPKSAVSRTSRGVEQQSRAVGIAAPTVSSKL